MTLQIVPRSVRAIADHLNTYYRVLRGIDADSLALRLSSGGAFEVRHSVTNTAVLRVTDAGATVSVGDNTVTNAKLAPNAVTTDKILDGTIVDLDISASADIDAAKLRAGTVGAGQIGNAALYSSHFVDNQILASRLFVFPGGAGVFRATGGPPASFGPLQATDIGAGVVGNTHLGNNAVASANIIDGAIVNADINAGAAIAYSKLALTNSIKSTDIADDAIMNVDVNPNAAIGLAKVAHVGAGNVLRSDGSANVGGQVVNADIAAAANINGAKLLDNSIPSSKMIGGVSIPNDSITSAHIADDTIVNADINAAAAIALAKLAHVGAGNVLRSNGSANVGGQVVNADVAAGAAIAVTKLGLVPTVVVTRVGNQSLADNTMTAIAWDSEVYDSEGMHDNASFNTRLTAITAGVYQVNLWVWWDIGTTGWRFASIRQVGVPVGNSRFTAIVSNYTEQFTGAQVRLAAGDYVEAYAIHINGTALNVMAGSRFSMARIGA